MHGRTLPCVAQVLKVQGVALVVKALKKHGPTSGPFTADACLALANFAAGKGEGAEAVSDQGGIDALATALRAHGASEPRVREWACAAMANLASSVHLRTRTRAYVHARMQPCRHMQTPTISPSQTHAPTPGTETPGFE